MKLLPSALLAFAQISIWSALAQTPAPTPQAPPQTTASQDINGQLVEAAEKGDKTSVESLLARGADPNAKDEKGQVALMAAAHAGHLAILESLLAANADINAKTNRATHP